MERWAWFEPIERRIAELRCTAAELLAREALEGGRPGEALRYAEGIIEYDPCDELGRRLAIRAHVAAGDYGRARQEYRRYADALARELQLEPSVGFEEFANA